MTTVCTAARTGRLDSEALRDIWLFSACSEAELRDIMDFCLPIDVAAGQLLVEADHRHHGCYVVLEGTAAVTRGTPIGHFGPGSIVGLASVLDRCPPNVTVVAQTDMCVLMVDPDQLADHLAAGNAWSVRHRLDILTAERPDCAVSR